MLGLLVCAELRGLRRHVWLLLSGLQLNVCGTMPVCGTFDGKPASGCEAETQTEELKNLKPKRQVGLEKTLQLSTEGFITLTYKGPLYPSTGELRTRLLLRLTSILVALCMSVSV